MRGMLGSGGAAYDAGPVCNAGCDCESRLVQTVATTPEHVQVARSVAAQGLVLLKNQAATLPLRPGVRIALVGSACDAPHVSVTAKWQQGDYYVVGGSGRVVSDKAISISRALLAHEGVAIGAISPSDILEEALEADASADVDVTIACAGASAFEGAPPPSRHSPSSPRHLPPSPTCQPKAPPSRPT